MRFLKCLVAGNGFRGCWLDEQGIVEVGFGNHKEMEIFWGFGSDPVMLLLSHAHFQLSVWMRTWVMTTVGVHEDVAKEEVQKGIIHIEMNYSPHLIFSEVTHDCQLSVSLHGYLSFTLSSVCSHSVLE